MKLTRSQLRKVIKESITRSVYDQLQSSIVPSIQSRLDGLNRYYSFAGHQTRSEFIEPIFQTGFRFKASLQSTASQFNNLSEFLRIGFDNRGGKISGSHQGSDALLILAIPKLKKNMRRRSTLEAVTDNLMSDFINLPESDIRDYSFDVLPSHFVFGAIDVRNGKFYQNPEFNNTLQAVANAIDTGEDVNMFTLRNETFRNLSPEPDMQQPQQQDYEVFTAPDGEEIIIPDEISLI